MPLVTTPFKVYRGSTGKGCLLEEQNSTSVTTFNLIDNSFLSTSFSTSIAVGFSKYRTSKTELEYASGCVFEISVDQPVHCIFLNMGIEDEVLFKPGTKLYVSGLLQRRSIDLVRRGYDWNTDFYSIPVLPLSLDKTKVQNFKDYPQQAKFIRNITEFKKTRLTYDD